MSFWHGIVSKKGFVVGLAPMDGVTDAVFRWMVAKHGKPDVLYTEFVSVEGLMRGRVERLLPAFAYTAIERPIVAQLFGVCVEDFYRATVLVCELGFDGVDINMGCPAKNVAQRGAGAGLIDSPDLAVEIVKTVKKAVLDWSSGSVGLSDVAPDRRWLEAVREFRRSGSCGGCVSSDSNGDSDGGVCGDVGGVGGEGVYGGIVGSREESGDEGVIGGVVEGGVENGREGRVCIPVSVKTRLGVDRVVVEWWMGVLGEAMPEVVALHGRTLRQGYSGIADWESIGKAVDIVHGWGGLLLGNGDVKSLDEAEYVVQKYGVDGVLIGRASFGRPDLFSGDGDDGMQDRRVKACRYMLEHSRKWESVFGSDWFMPMRKHLGWYCRGFDGAKDLRKKLLQCSSADEVEKLLRES